MKRARQYDSVNHVLNAQVCVYLKVHITKLQLQITFPKPLYHIARFFLGEFIFIVSTWNLFFLFFVNLVPNAQVCVYLTIHITKLQNYNYKQHFQNLSIYHIARFFWGEFIFIVSTSNLFFLHILTFFVKRNGPNRQIF